jgi:hypothetical protein
MKLYQSITVCVALMAGVTADGCFAQSAIKQEESVADGNAPQVSAVAVQTVTVTRRHRCVSFTEAVSNEASPVRRGVSTIELSSGRSGPSVLDI